MTEVRQLQAEDRSAWEVLWDAYLDFYREPLPEDVTEGTFGRLVSQSDGLVGLVAESDAGEVVGFAHLVFHPSTWSKGTYCYLEDLFVARQARGGDVSRLLIEAVYAEADRRGATRTYWATQEFNSAARSLYDRVAHRTSFIIYDR